ncbi:zinc finger protein 420-like isoform X2 [Pelobates fuscus]|uniref:zinc finger protein 420-like isoform X2 n=1 Tax=Pelobates fuscus TaxID=191477 RepID=UPI002FE4602D
MSEGTLQGRDDGEFDLDLFFFEPPAAHSDIVSMLDRGADTCSEALQLSTRGAAGVNVLSDGNSMNNSQNGLSSPHFIPQEMQLPNNDLSSCYPRDSSWGMCSASTLQITLSRTSPDKGIQSDRSPSDISSIIAHLRSLAGETADTSTRPDEDSMNKTDSYADRVIEAPVKNHNESFANGNSDSTNSPPNCLEKHLDFQEILGNETIGGEYPFINVESIIKGKPSTKTYICSYCGKSCPCRSAFIRHQRIHTGEKPYHCTECGKSFIQSSDYNNHMRSHTGEKPYSCAECGKSFSRNTYLVTHSRTHTKEKPYLCTVCGKSFIQHSHLSLHLRIHSGEKPYICIECGNCFSRSSTLVKHKKSHRRKTLHMYKKKNEEHDHGLFAYNSTQSWEALIDGKEESLLNSQQTEVKLENEETPDHLQQTESCKKSYKDEKKISRKIMRTSLGKFLVYDKGSGENIRPISHHRKFQRKKNYLPGETNKSSCNRDTQTSNHLTETRVVKVEDSPKNDYENSCTLSGTTDNTKMQNINSEYEFRRDKSCTEPTKSAAATLPTREEADPPHSDLQNCYKMNDTTYKSVCPIPPETSSFLGGKIQKAAYVCSYCGKGCPCKSAFLRHQRIHTGEKPYSCSECGKRFIQSSDYNNHLRSHTGEKPYTCGECGKGFSRSTYLMTHSRIHTKEKPYTCAHCGKSFVQHSHLAIHSRIHSGEKPYTCSECGKPFSRSSTLTKHQKSHNKKKVNSMVASNSAVSPLNLPKLLSVTEKTVKEPTTKI